ncbi:hypothetical protein BDQ94DRAFT_164198 [Aspergillus welwitschiae]|uniref:Uncharacterized protein n=1 Tax=Aspergillus welwitschiae TaxID=1341132 RepID=A0A3F3PIL1_9EURO|nr:hypothetical protein BDQ94DRAFT_164198 [Aspergillus welwitschiae]RDH26790.1 hypothetical protein BDQ94DRAFT_164198 [Aspergillus welwitschiae]
MPLLVSHAKVDHVDALTGRLAAVELKEEEEARNPRCFNLFAPYLEEGSPRFVEHLTRKLIPKRLSSLRQIHQLLVDESCPLYRAGREFQVKHGISEASFQNWKELVCGWLDFPVILLLNPSPFDVLGYEQMFQKSPTLGWLEKNLEVMKLELHNVIVVDTFQMVSDELLESKRSAEDRSELVTDSLEHRWTCLRYIPLQIVISCQCSSKARNEKWESSGGLRAEELSSSEAGARQELVKMMDVDGHQMMEGVLKKLFTKVLGTFGRWKERRLAKRREAARAEVILVKESVRDGMKLLMKQMQLFGQICRQECKKDAELSEAAKRVEEWRKQIEDWAGEMDD